jgi:SAM-dependent methyltransferase
LNPEERNAAIRRYADRLRQHGADVKALGWRDQEQQALRFDILAADGVALAGMRVLDVGCGFGDLYSHLAQRGIEVEYTGCDISRDVLEIAQTRHPGLEFEERDIVDKPYPERSFDYVIISGVFNHRLADNQRFLKETLQAAFNACRVAVAANMTTDHVDYRDEYLYYFNPESVLAFCRTLTRHVAMRHDYPLYEFTVFLRRNAITT